MQQKYAELVVKIYSVVYWIEAVLVFLAGLVVGFFTPFAVTMIKTYGDLSGLPPDWPAGAFDQLALGLGLFIGLLLVGIGLVLALFAMRIWRRRPWTRIALIVLSALSLFSAPFGTILGAFGIYAFGFDKTVIALFSETAPPVVAKKKK